MHTVMDIWYIKFLALLWRCEHGISVKGGHCHGETATLLTYHRSLRDQEAYSQNSNVSHHLSATQLAQVST